MICSKEISSKDKRNQFNEFSYEFFCRSSLTKGLMKSALNQLPIIGDNTGKTLKTTNM